MKKFKLIISFILLISLLCCFSVACNKQSLTIPTDFTINDEYKLSWSPIKDARSYVLKVTSEDGESKEYSSRRAYYSMSKLKEGNYNVSVKAVSGNKGVADSEWSQTFDFKKDYESGCIYTAINNKTEYEVTKVGTASGVVDLGDTYRGKPVTSIAESAFKGSSRLEKVTIGKYVKTIGKNAFYNCSRLAEITIPETVVSIGEAAFNACRSLQSVQLPSGLKEIPSYLFDSCTSLVTVNLPAVDYIGQYAFERTLLISVSIPDTVKAINEGAFSSCGALTTLSIGAGVEEIGRDAFYKCTNLEEVTFSEQSSLKTIGAGAFASCSVLASLTIPEGVTDISENAFYDSKSLAHIDLPDSLTHVGQNVFNGTKIYIDAVEKGQFVYADNWLVSWTGRSDPEIKKQFTNLNKTTLGNDKVEGIADYVFYNSNLISIDLPDSVRIIGKCAFANNSQLGRLYTFENNETEEGNLQLIDEFAFYNCKLLNRVFLNKGLKEINSYAFYNCSSLVNNSVIGYSIIPNTVEHIGTRVFDETRLYESAEDVVYAGSWIVGYKGSNASSVIIKGLEEISVRGIADYAFYKHDELKSISLSAANANSVRYIGRGAFYGCSGLSAVSFSRVLERIEDYTFYKCSSLFKLSLTPRLKSIGRSAFYKCVNLDELDLSGTQVSEIGPYAFYGCKNIKKINLGNSLQSIEKYTFYNCISVTDLVIPDTVTEIGERAFYKCVFLENVDFGNGVKSIGDNAFNGCTSLTALTIPSSVEKIGNYAFYKCTGITSLNMAEGVREIGDYAFGNLSLITGLDIPDSVETVGRYAFMNCSSLGAVNINAEKMSLGIHAFYGCLNMTVYINTSTVPDTWDNRWNSSFRPVVLGCELSSDGEYIVSVEIVEKTLVNPNAINGVVSPVREGYVFLGWATQNGATEAEYETGQLNDLSVGTTVYAVWQQKIN